MLANNKTNELIGITFYLKKNAFGDCGYWRIQINPIASLASRNLPGGCTMLERGPSGNRLPKFGLCVLCTIPIIRNQCHHRYNLIQSLLEQAYSLLLKRFEQGRHLLTSFYSRTCSIAFVVREVPLYIFITFGQSDGYPVFDFPFASKAARTSARS